MWTYGFLHMTKLMVRLLVLAPQLRGICSWVAEAGTPQKAIVAGIVGPSRRRGGLSFLRRRSHECTGGIHTGRQAAWWQTANHFIWAEWNMMEYCYDFGTSRSRHAKANTVKNTNVLQKNQNNNPVVLYNNNNTITTTTATIVVIFNDKIKKSGLV